MNSHRSGETITYRTGKDLDLDTVIELYRASTLGQRRPVDDRERLGVMLREASLVITAWDRGLLVGLARSLTDKRYVTYLSDLAVRQSHQHSGIGRELVRQTQRAAPDAQIVLLSAPQAMGFYPRIGFTAHPGAWVLKPGAELS